MFKIKAGSHFQIFEYPMGGKPEAILGLEIGFMSKIYLTISDPLRAER
jgi:hypothetical protein